MSEPPDAGEILEAAERAAAAGDLAAAGELLRTLAQLQETTLGPSHPNLALTLNNLAIVSEKTGRQGDAETFYRRAAAIASTSFPADHPMVAESRQNLEDFCRSYGLPIDPPPVATTPPSAMTSPPDLQSRAPAAASPAKTPHAVAPVPDVPPGPSHVLTWGAIGVAVLVMAVLLAMRWSSREGSSSAPASESSAKAPAMSSAASSDSVEEPRPPKTGPQADRRAADRPSTPAASAPVTLAAAELCETFSTRDDDWQCKRAGGSVSAGRIVMYTRVKSTRDNVVVHRWFLDNALQQSVRLMTRANETAGYRTFSRQSVGPGQHWRVEVRNADGALLHEQRFSVR
jgi:hypothetical protein